MKSYSVSKLIRYSILFVFAVLCIVMLAFPTIYACKSYSEDIYPDADNGFTWLTFESNFIPEEDVYDAWDYRNYWDSGVYWDEYKIPVGIISIFQLLF